MKSRYTAIDLFQGVGGASLGLESAGFKVVASSDMDPVACDYYWKNLGLKPFCGDLSRITGLDILEVSCLARGEVDLVTGCPPCQGFSSLRRTRHPSGGDERNDLVRVFLERVQEMEPKAVMFENVPGMVKGAGSRHFQFYLAKMEKFGYETSWGVVNAADYGVPQFRKRVVALSVKDAGTAPPLPPGSHAKPEALVSDQEPWKTVRDAIGDLPPLEQGESHPSIPNHAARKHSRRVSNLIYSIPKNGGSRRSLPREYWLPCHLKLSKEKRGGAENVYGRMWWDRPSPTMTCRCTTPSCGRFLHPEQDRAITPREAARLQTFPDSFVFPEEFCHAERLIGNAVPPALVKVLAKSLLDFL